MSDDYAHSNNTHHQQIPRGSCQKGQICCFQRDIQWRVARSFLNGENRSTFLNGENRSTFNCQAQLQRQLQLLLYTYMIVVILAPKFEWCSSKNVAGKIKLIKAAKIYILVISWEIWRIGYFQEFLASELQKTTTSHRKHLEGCK